MLKISTFPESPVFYPSDLDLLKQVFDELCREAGLSPTSEEAERVASALIMNFQYGISEPDMLKIAARSRRAA